MDNVKTVALIGTLGGILVSILVLLGPLSYAIGGYVTGWILAHIFRFAGNWVVDGARLLGLTIPLTALPHLGAFLGFVGAFFRAHQTNNNKR